MGPQTLSRTLLRLSLLSVSLCLTGCPGLRNALPSTLAVAQPDSASAHAFTLPGRIGGPSTVTPTVLPLGTSHTQAAYRIHRIEWAVLGIADHTQPRRVRSLADATSEVVLLRENAYPADRNGLAILPIANPTDPVPIDQRVGWFMQPINVGYWHRFYW